MVSGKQLRMALDKFMKSPVCQHARVQIELPNGEMYDLTAMMLLESKILGTSETHRLVLKAEKPTRVMGDVIKTNLCVSLVPKTLFSNNIIAVKSYISPLGNSI